MSLTALFLEAVKFSLEFTLSFLKTSNTRAEILSKPFSDLSEKIGKVVIKQVKL